MNLSEKMVRGVMVAGIVLVASLALYGAVTAYKAIFENDPEFTPIEVGKAVGFCVDREGSDAVRYCACIHNAQVANGMKPSDVVFGLPNPYTDKIAKEAMKTCASLKPGT